MIFRKTSQSKIGNEFCNRNWVYTWSIYPPWGFGARAHASLIAKRQTERERKKMPHLGTKAGPVFQPSQPPSHLQYEGREIRCIAFTLHCSPHCPLLRDDAIVWYSPMTNEVFENYQWVGKCASAMSPFCWEETLLIFFFSSLSPPPLNREFAERFFECQKKDWACAATGKTGLSFEDALKVCVCCMCAICVCMYVCMLCMVMCVYVCVWMNKSMKF